MARVFKGVRVATFKLSDETETGSNGVDLRFVRRFHGIGCHPFDATRAGFFHLWIFELISAFELLRFVPAGTNRGPAGKLPTARSKSNHPTFQDASFGAKQFHQIDGRAVMPQAACESDNHNDKRNRDQRMLSDDRVA